MVDVDYGGRIVELDGRTGHFEVAGWCRDMLRDDLHTVRGRAVLRFPAFVLLTRPHLVAHLEAEALQRLGWQGQEMEETVFFQAGGMALILWGRAKLAADSGVEDIAPGAVALAQNVRSRAEVDATIAAAAAAGAEITQPPRETFYGGYAGHFRDPDGHVWEIAWNPGFTLNPDGSLTLPDLDAA